MLLICLLSLVWDDEIVDNTFHYSSFLIKILLIIHFDTFLAAKEYETISQILVCIFSVVHWRGYAFDVLITDSICDGYLGIGAL